MKKIFFVVLLLLVSFGELNAQKTEEDKTTYFVDLKPNKIKNYQIKQTILVDSVETSFPVEFTQVIAKGNHYIAYYDKDKIFCIAHRKLKEKSFRKTILNSKIAWDSHNYTEMIVDKQGYIHVSGNMHNVPLNYWRSKKPYDASVFEDVHYMTGLEEENVTYPHFIKTNEGSLLFHYRYGFSGAGYEVYNLWHPETKTWSRFLDKPLIDGEGKRNAYMTGPIYDKDGYYHLYWVWRETPNCATNHTFSYARSKDLKNWENAAGKKVASPMVYNETELTVDASDKTLGTGMLNGVQAHTLDSRNRVVLCNMKYDTLGNSQLYVYRLNEKNIWEEKCITNWDYHFGFEGYGSIVFEISIKGMRTLKNGELGISYYHSKYGTGEIIINEKTLEPIEIREFAQEYPRELESLRTKGQYVKPLEVKIKKSGKFILRWETMGASNDRKPKGKLPPNGILEVIELK